MVKTKRKMVAKMAVHSRFDVILMIIAKQMNGGGFTGNVRHSYIQCE